MTEENVLVPMERIEGAILLVRGQKVLLDSDLAELYGVATKALNQAVKRNPKRFPPDFMFRLTAEEFAILKSQNVASSWGGRRTLPYAFTEQGIAMLSSVLASDRAAEVNVETMRAFVRLRRALVSHEEIARRLDELAATVGEHGEQIGAIVAWIAVPGVEGTFPACRTCDDLGTVPNPAWHSERAIFAYTRMGRGNVPPAPSRRAHDAAPGFCLQMVCGSPAPALRRGAGPTQ